MPNYVVDTSIVADVLITGSFTAHAEALILSVSRTTSLLVPEFCVVECINVLWKRVRAGELTQEEAEQLADDLKILPLTLVSVKNVLPRALQIGLAHQLAIYDSIYIALAEKYGYPLITADAKQEKAARAIGITIKPVTDF